MLIDRRIGKYAEKILSKDFGRIKTRYSVMKRRWGSCNPQNRITFNIELVKTPIQCVDYVIVHEICHLVHPNHDKSFYRTIRIIMPDWQKRKERLELFGGI